MPDGRFEMSPRQLPGLVGGEFRRATRGEEQDDIQAVLGGVALHVFEVVDHLVTDTESMGGGADARQPRFLTRGQEGEFEREAQQDAGFADDDFFVPSHFGEGAVLGGQLRALALDHLGRAGVNAAQQGGQRSGVREVGQGAIGGRKQEVAGAEGDVRTESGAHGRKTAAEFLLILEVIVDQRGVVEEFDAGGEADRLVADDTEGLTGMLGQPGAHSLAAGFEMIAGGAQRGGLAGGHAGPRRHPDKPKHQTFDLEEGGVGGGVHQVG